MSLDDQGINWGEFYKAYSGVRFTIKKDECQIFVPTYSNIAHSTTERLSAGGETVTLPTSGTVMTFRDSWSSNTFLVAGEPDRLNEVFLRDLWTYPESNVKWDDFQEKLSLQDIEVEETNLEDFLSNLDSFLVFNKLNKFGNVWWVGRVKVDFQNNDSQYSNVIIPNNSTENIEATDFIKFWSPDKYINDEYKKYVSNPSQYSGFLTSDEFRNGGWLSIPHLRISTKPFEKLKIAEILLNINYIFDPQHFGNYHGLNSQLAVRIKDNTSSLVLDSSQKKNTQNSSLFSDTIISHWIGTLTSTNNITTLGPIGTYTEDSCILKQNEINNIPEDSLENKLSHAIDAQISIKPDYSSDEIEFLGTIDPINWISANTSETENPHKIGALNEDRAFGSASGNIDNGIVVGGIKTTETSVTSVLSNAEIWSNNTFVKDVSINLNSPRCFHLQGGEGSSSCVILGGFSEMNTLDVSQFSKFGKTAVRDDMESLTKNDDLGISYFKTITDYSMAVARGEAAGSLQVKTEVRQDKYEVEDLIKGYNITPNDEQKILEFVNDASNDTLNNIPVPSNFRRYNVSNIEGFVYSGNTTGKVYLLDVPESDDIIDKFEKINTTYVDVSQNIISSATDSSIEGLLNSIDSGEVEDVINSVIMIPGNSEDGITLNLEQCGKYRLLFTEGSYIYNDSASRDGEVIAEVMSIRSNIAYGERVTLPYCGKYTITYINGQWTENFNSAPYDNTALMVLLNNNVIANPIFATVDISGGTANEYTFCNDIEGSELRLTVSDWKFDDNGGSVNVKVVYSGTSGCSACNSDLNAYGSNTEVLLNEQTITNTFNSGIMTSQTNVENYINARPTQKEYTFCVGLPNSTLRLKMLDISDSNIENNGGFVNARLYYLGTQECSCILDEEADTTQSDIAITYGTLDPTKNYPVRCHGACYVGDNNSGISTGGRTEYNTISNIECNLREKYGLIAKNSCTTDSILENELESNRVLDLVYEYNGVTWIRKQNLFESVYYHTGVGTSENAIFWGGLHDTLNTFSYNVNIETADVSAMSVSAFSCQENKTSSIETTELFGSEYEELPILENSECWNIPTWETSAITGSKTNDPRYRTGEATLAYATDPNFPEIILATVGPINPTSFTSQDTSGYTFTISAPNKLSVEKTYSPSEAQFIAIGYVLENNLVTSKTIQGNIFVSNLVLNLTSLDYDMYPTASYGGSISFNLTDIRVINGGQVLIYYEIIHINTNFNLRGYGILTFNSMEEIWQSIKNNESISAVSNSFTILDSTESSDLINETITGNCTLTFNIITDSTTLIGVENIEETWGSQNCDFTLSDFITFDFNYYDDNNQRWGYPLWVKGLVDEISGFFRIEYDYSTKLAESTSTEGQNIFEVSNINLEINDISSIVNNRFLIAGTTTKQTHTFTAINDTMFVDDLSAALNLYSYCESVTASTSQSIDISAQDYGYSEWASSFIQEYRSDERFNAVDDFIPSNSEGIIGNNNLISYIKNPWKRFMDGVGLGGDVPDYSTIVDLEGIRKSVNEWGNIGSWYIGQMAFGTPDRAVVVGGHEINPSSNKIGLHAHPTSKRIFIWDFAQIPPEDTYSKNYIGRRLWTYYVDSNGIIVPCGVKTTFGTTIFEAGSNIVVERMGTVDFVDINTITVKFDSPMPEEIGTNYSISLMPNDNIKTWWQNKTINGFILTVELSSWTGKIDYIATAEMTVTEEDINNLDPLDGYIFDK